MGDCVLRTIESFAEVIPRHFVRKTGRVPSTSMGVVAEREDLNHLRRS